MKEIAEGILSQLKEIIEEEKATCVVYNKKGVIFVHKSKGVKPITDFWLSGDLKDSIVVDKVIGKANAAFMVSGGVKYVHTKMISEPAKMLLERENIKFTYDTLVPKILNRTGDGLCPMESSVIDETDIVKSIEKVFDKMKMMNIL